MIDLERIKNACTELNRRIGVGLEVLDQNQSVIASIISRGVAKSKDNYISASPRTDKSYTVRIFHNDSSLLNDATVQVIMMYLEPYFVSKTVVDVLVEAIENSTQRDDIIKNLKDCGVDNKLTYRLYLLSAAEEHRDDVLDIASQIIEPYSNDVIFPISSKHILLIKECDDELTPDDAQELAYALEQSISLEIPKNKMSISVSGVYNSLDEIKKAYTTSCDTMRIGAICNAGKTVFVSDKLRLEELLDKLPHEVLTNILESYSTDTISEAWDDKMIDTVHALFENNLNLSVTARELYTHRNTLVYRLDKIKKISGFDLRSFDDAVMLKILMTADKLSSAQKN